MHDEGIILWGMGDDTILAIPEFVKPPYRDRILDTLRELGWVINPDGTFPEVLPDGIRQNWDPLYGATPIYDGLVYRETSRAFYFPGCEGGISFLRYTGDDGEYTGRTHLESIYWDTTPQEINENFRNLLLKGEL